MDREPVADGGRATRVVLAVLGVGLLLRVALLAARGPLWLDEAWLANNIVQRSFMGLLRPLDFGQVAPPLFLWLERAAFVVAGPREWALRLPALVASVGVIPLVWASSRHLLPRSGALLATALAAVSPLLIRYGAELKPYALDAFFAALLIFLALELARRPTRRQWWRLGCWGAVAVMATTPGILAASGVAFGLLFEPKLGTPRGRTARLAGVLAVWAALFIVQYLLIYRPGAAIMADAWTLAGGGDADPAVERALSALREFLLRGVYGVGLRSWLPPKTVTATVLVAGLGAVSLVWHQRARALVVLGPLLALATAIALRQWPATPRLMFLALPVVCMLLPAGIGAIASLAGRQQRLLGVGLGLAFLLPALAGGIIAAIEPTRFDDAPGALAELERRSAPGSAVYWFARGRSACAFYTTAPGEEVRCRIPGHQMIRGVFRGADDEAFADDEVQRILDAGVTEVWLAFASGDQRDLRDVVERLERVPATLLETWEGEGYTLLLYRMRGPSPR